MKTMVALFVAIAAILGIALMVRKRTTTTTATGTTPPTTTPPGTTPPAPVVNASGQVISALNWLTGTESEKAAALARMQADPTDKEWFAVMDSLGNPTGNITYETWADATKGASAAVTTVTTNNATRLAEIAEWNKKGATVGIGPLPMTATTVDIAEYSAEYANNPNNPANKDDNSLGLFGTLLNTVGTSVGLGRVGSDITGVAALST